MRAVLLSVSCEWRRGDLPAAASTSSAAAGKKLFPLIDRTCKLMDAIFRVDGNASPPARMPPAPGIPGCSTAPRRPRWWCGRRADRDAGADAHRARHHRPDATGAGGAADAGEEVLREGRKIQLCAVRLFADGALAVGATVLKIKSQANELPPEDASRRSSYPAPINRASSTPTSPRALSSQACRCAPRAAISACPDPARSGTARPAVVKSPVSQAMRAVVAADFCNGTSAVLDFRPMDLSQRRPHRQHGAAAGRRIDLLDAKSWIGRTARALRSRLADDSGYFGRAIQSLVIEKR